MKPLKTLIVEDSLQDAELLLRHLSKHGFAVQSEIVQTPAALKVALAESSWDIVLSDYSMPHFTGLDALAILKESGRDIPIIIISGTIGEDAAVEAMVVGVDDYLMKGNLTRLSPAIERELENATRRRAQKQAEEALRSSEASLANAQRIAHIGNWDLDIQNNRLVWSDEIYRIFGLSQDQFEGTFEAFFERIHPEDRELVQSSVDATLTQNAPHSYEHRIVRPNGEERIVCEIGEVTFDESGKPKRFTGTVQDITERKNSEKEKALLTAQLENQHQRLNNIIANVPGVVWESWGKPGDANQRINFISDYVETMLGYSIEDWLSTPNFWLTIAHPEDKELAGLSAASNFANGDKGTNQFRWIAKDGRVIWVEAQSVPIVNEFGVHVGMRGVNLDISERKRAEQLILESEEKYRNIVETANEGIWLIDVSGHTTYVNRQMAEMLGYTIDEMLGRPLFDFVFENDVSAASVQFEKRKQGESQSGEFRLRRKDGSGIDTLYNACPTKNQAGKIVGFLTMITDITERKSADRLLRDAEANYRNLVESSPAVVYLAQPFLPYSTIYVSPNVTKFGYPFEEWLSRTDMWVSLIHEEDRERVLRTTEAAMINGLDTDLVYRIAARDGSIFWMHDKGRFVLDNQGKRIGWQGVMLDITETKQLEEQLRQSQKLESVGLLAGGIAHDFNNMLTAINGYSELTLRKLEPGNPLRHNIEEIKKAGERSALLTNQLLAFSRQQVLQPVVLDLNEIITDTIKMLQRLIGEDVELVTVLKPKTGRVNVDQGQLSQIILNLAVNARDAMPLGGVLTIETGNVFLEPDDSRQKLGILPGAYVLLAVSDTGSGIEAKIQRHIFEPFFTTKDVGRGTGLGLATVYGIVKQSGGNIEVDSKVGVGTTFKIYLPRVAEESRAVSKNTLTELLGGTETILLVEDEELVRNLSREILETCGYKVIEAVNGIEAVAICQANNCHIDLLLTDVVMPQMGGRELADKLGEKLPNLRILFTSGYTDDAFVRHSIIGTNTNFIQKPFTPEALASKIRDVFNYS